METDSEVKSCLDMEAPVVVRGRPGGGPIDQLYYIPGRNASVRIRECERTVVRAIPPPATIANARDLVGCQRVSRLNKVSRLSAT